MISISNIFKSYLGTLCAIVYKSTLSMWYLFMGRFVGYYTVYKSTLSMWYLFMGRFVGYYIVYKSTLSMWYLFMGRFVGYYMNLQNITINDIV